MVIRARFFLHQDLQTLKLIPLFKEDLSSPKIVQKRSSSNDHLAAVQADHVIL